MTSSDFPNKYETTESSPETKITDAFSSLSDENTLSNEQVFAGNKEPVFDPASSEK